MPITMPNFTTACTFSRGATGAARSVLLPVLIAGLWACDRFERINPYDPEAELGKVGS